MLQIKDFTLEAQIENQFKISSPKTRQTIGCSINRLPLLVIESRSTPEANAQTFLIKSDSTILPMAVGGVQRNLRRPGPLNSFHQVLHPIYTKASPTRAPVARFHHSCATANVHVNTSAMIPVILSRTSLQDSISPMLPNKLFSSSWVMF